MRAAANACSDWWGIDEDLAPWSSPAMQSTPPLRPAPAKFPCLSTSPLRSTPGPFPYQIANTPSYFAPGKISVC